MRARVQLLLLTGIALIAASGFAQGTKTHGGDSDAQPDSGAHQIAAPAVPRAGMSENDTAGKPAERKKQRIRYTFPPAAAKRM